MPPTDTLYDRKRSFFLEALGYPDTVAKSLTDLEWEFYSNPRSLLDPTTLIRITDAAPLNNTTTLTPDDVIIASLDAATTYVIEGAIFYDATSVADMRYMFSFTSDPTLMSVSAPNIQTGATNAIATGHFGMKTFNTAYQVGGAGAGVLMAVQFMGIVITNLATTMRLQYSPVNLEASDMIIKAGTYLSYRKAA